MDACEPAPLKKYLAKMSMLLKVVDIVHEH